MGKRIREIYRKKGVKPPNGKGIHTEKFHRIVAGIKASGQRGVNPYAVAMAKLGRSGAVKKSHRKQNSPLHTNHIEIDKHSRGFIT